jgi:alanyl-tRNA synthetase
MLTAELMKKEKLLMAKQLVNNDHPQVIEIWNNVFIQFNRLKDGSLEPLPAKHVDTGMGFERLVRVIQNKTSNYDTDVFTGTIAATEKITGKKYDYSDGKEAVAFRVIADHIRAISFTIADGQLPSNTGAGYVIRRILRRAVRYYFSYLDYKLPLLFQLLPVIGKQFENVFPELEKQIDFVSKVVKEEEDAFLKTLDKGLLKLEMYFSLEGFQDFLKGDSKAYVLPGKVAFELYDTYGFPLDLTKLIISEKSNQLSVDEAGFEAEMQLQKNRSRAATTIDTEDWIVLDEKPVNFVGYDDLNVTTKVLKYRSIKAKGKEQYQLVLKTTPFYAESGGQVGDTGKLFFGEEVIRVTDTKKENELIIHFTDQLPADITLPVKAVVNAAKRLETASNHTATHLMHAALRKVLGTHVHQKGSLVNSEYLRFDFSHFAKMTDDELRTVELMVNDKIRENIKVEITYMPKTQAMAKGAMALFGEKYGDTVRVVTVDPDFSVELCGGTHVFYTGMIGTFKILSETATAAGVRRIEAITGVAAQNYFYDQLKGIKEIAALLKTSDPVKSLKQLVEENNTLKKKIESLEAKQLAVIKNELLNKVQIINGTSFIGEVLEVSNADALKKVSFDLKASLNNYITVLAANIEGKAAVAVSMDDNFIAAKNTDAPKIIKEYIAPLIKGGGGGQKTLATAGGQDAGNLQQVIEKVKGLL